MTRTVLLKALCRSLLLSLLALGFAAAAEAREETIRWTHPLGGQVAAFHIQVGTSPGATDLMDQAIGVPTPDGQGVYSLSLDLNTEETVYVRMTAVNTGDVHSDPSNTVSRSVALGMPGQPIVRAP